MFNLRILTPDSIHFSGAVDAVYAPGESGEVGILENHAPFLTNLKEGIIEVEQDGKKREIPVTEGVLEVKESGEVVILV